jgi:hypothetical protein
VIDNTECEYSRCLREGNSTQFFFSGWRSVHPSPLRRQAFKSQRVPDMIATIHSKLS